MKSKLVVFALAAAVGGGVWMKHRNNESSEAVGFELSGEASTDWYRYGSIASARADAEEMGRPIAIMLYADDTTCAIHNGKRTEWKRNSALDEFVKIDLPVDALSYAPFYFELLKDGGQRPGGTVPQLLLGTADGRYLGSLGADSTDIASSKLLRGIVTR